MELTGVSPTVGPVTLVQSPVQPSLGEVTRITPGIDFPAESFFDVYMRIQLPGPGLTLTHPIRRLEQRTIPFLQLRTRSARFESWESWAKAGWVRCFSRSSSNRCAAELH